MIGGLLGQHVGLVATVLIGAAVGSLAFAWICGPIRLTSTRGPRPPRLRLSLRTGRTPRSVPPSGGSTCRR